MDIFYLIIGLLALILGGEFLVKGSVALAVRMRVSMVVIGLTVVSFATSAPELIVSIYSALSGHPDIALGNVIGSNIANISLVLGITALISPLSFQQRLYRFDIPVMLLASALFGVFLYSNSSLNFWEGLCFVLLLSILTIYLIRRSRKEEKMNGENSAEQVPLVKLFVYLSLGAISLYFGSHWLVGGATGIARTIGVSERVISVSIVAFGTSVPELAASIIAVFKKEKDLSIGNLIGSNIFNIFAVLGITSMIQPIYVVDEGLITNDIWWMFGVALLLYPMMFLFHKKHIGRLEGFMLFVLYIAYISLLF
ncbi:MAG: calcium/sodium antiporter [Flavobacteriales bacterium]|nr:calcium/sodium antiporter [Flavobacteriales bacterium]